MNTIINELFYVCSSLFTKIGLMILQLVSPSLINTMCVRKNKKKNFWMISFFKNSINVKTLSILADSSFCFYQGKKIFERNKKKRLGMLFREEKCIYRSRDVENMRWALSSKVRLMLCPHILKFCYF